MLRWLTASQPVGWSSLWGLELGNELNSCLNGYAGAKAQAADFMALKKLVDAAWATAAANSAAAAAAAPPRLVGPDTHSAAEFSEDGVEWFSTFAGAADWAVDQHTFHMYSLGNGPKLDPRKHVELQGLSGIGI